MIQTISSINWYSPANAQILKLQQKNRSAVARLQHETIKACEKLKIWWNDDNTMNADLKGFSN
jgi:hypothetical protein